MIRLMRLIIALPIAAAPAAAQDGSPDATSTPATAPATAPTTQPVLIGRWVVTVTPAEPISQPKIASEHELIFDVRRMQAIGPLGEAFGWSPYAYHAPDFRAVFDREESGNVLWAGEITPDNVLRGMIIQTQPNGRLQIYHFAGEKREDTQPALPTGE